MKKCILLLILLIALPVHSFELYTWELANGSTCPVEAPVNGSYATVNTEAGLTAERQLAAGLALDLTDGGANSTITYAFDPTELLGSRTWGEGSTDTIVWSFNRATGTDPTLTAIDNGFTIHSNLNLGDSTHIGNLYLHNAGAITLYDSADNTFVSMSVNNGTTVLNFDGTIDADGLQVGGVPVLTTLPAVTYEKTFGFDGLLYTRTGLMRWYPPTAITLVSVTAAVSTGHAPTGATILVDVHRDDVTIFTTQGNRPSIAISGNVSSAMVPDVVAVPITSFLTCDIDQIGNVLAGSDLTVRIIYTIP